MITRRTFALSAGAALAAPLPASAQQWQPSGPIRIVVPFPAGGTTDILARLFAQRMTETMGVSVVVENRGGGGGSIGADVVAKTAPDGQTLLIRARSNGAVSLWSVDVASGDATELDAPTDTIPTWQRLAA